MPNLYKLPLMVSYIDNICNEYINSNLNNGNKIHKISNKQRVWLIFCLSMMVLTNSINWDRFQRFSLASYKTKALSFMFHHSAIPFKLLFESGIKTIIRIYKITNGHIIVDDTDRPRCKIIKKIAFVFKSFNKKTGGYFQCQNLVFIILVTNKLTIPVGFKFYTPCPYTKKFEELDKNIRRLNKEGFLDINGKKLKRPSKPERSANHPTRNQLSVQLVNEFKEKFPEIEIISCSFDEAYSSGENLRQIENLIPKTTVISEFSSSIIVSDSRRSAPIATYFNSIPTQKIPLQIRGGKNQNIDIKNARLYVPAHGRNYNVVALRYQDEKDYRYIITSNLNWRAKDVVHAYTFRWLVEVFFSIGNVLKVGDKPPCSRKMPEHFGEYT